MKNVVDKLKTQEQVAFTPHGNSMSPKIEDGEEVIVCRIKEDPIVGDIILCKVKGRFLLHLIKTIKTTKNGNKRFLISNNKGKINGWIGIKAIFGVKI